MTNNNRQLPPEMLIRIGRIPGLWHVYNDRDGHVFITATPDGMADRVAVFGKGKSALPQMQAALHLLEGLMSHLGYEDPPSARIDPNRWVTVRWLRTELNDAGADVEAFRQFVVERGNEFLADSKIDFYHTFDEGKIKEVMVRNHDSGEEYLVYVCGMTYNPDNPVHVAYDEGYRGTGIAYWDVPLLFIDGPLQHGIGYMLDDVTEIIPFDR